MLVTSYLRARSGRVELKASLGKKSSETLSQKPEKKEIENTKEKQKDVAQVVKSLPNVQEALGSVPSNTHTRFLTVCVQSCPDKAMFRNKTVLFVC